MNPLYANQLNSAYKQTIGKDDSDCHHPFASKDSIPDLVKKWFSNLTYQTNEKLEGRTVKNFDECDIIQLSSGELSPSHRRVTSCYHSFYLLSGLISGEEKTKRLYSWNSCTYDIKIHFNEKLPVLHLYDFASAYALLQHPSLKIEEDETNLTIQTLVSRVFPRFSKIVKDCVKDIPKNKVFCETIKSKIAGKMLELQLNTVKSLKTTIEDNGCLVDKDKSFIYYISIQHTRFLQQPHVHYFAVEQYLAPEGYVTYRLYNSYQNKYTCSDWLENKIQYELSPDQVLQLLNLFASFYKDGTISEEGLRLWNVFFRVDAKYIRDFLSPVLWFNVPGVGQELKGLTIRFMYDCFSPSSLIKKLKQELCILNLTKSIENHKLTPQTM